MRRFNLFDAAIAAFVVILVPIAYGTYLLFRPPHPVISSVERVEISSDQRRNGPVASTRLKVRGSGLRPMLRASIDNTPAVAFVLETANSADVLAGDVPPGAHDLVLYDGVQEVARAPKAVIVEPAATRNAEVRMRVDSPSEVLQLVKTGDRDGFGNPSLALVSRIEKDVLTLRMGVAAAGQEWQYAAGGFQVIKPGAPLTLSTPRYLLKGTILSVSLEQP